MRKLLIAVILTLLATSTFAQFRDAEWGMTRAEIEQLEGTPHFLETDIDEDDNKIEILAFNRPMFGSTIPVRFAINEEYGLVWTSLTVPESLRSRVTDALSVRYGSTFAGMDSYWSLEDQIVFATKPENDVFVVWAIFVGEYNPRHRRADADSF